MSVTTRRIEKDWTQEQLAQASGLSTRTVQRIESGSSANLESLKCLAAVFETTVAELIKEQEMQTELGADANDDTVRRTALEEEAII